MDDVQRMHERRQTRAAIVSKLLKRWDATYPNLWAGSVPFNPPDLDERLLRLFTEWVAETLVP